ncbi:DNA-binding transcriptional ArsR family regulator [Hamadaea flava]|uniref:Winged helix-turn-helix domain-containing protein n=1 Tax=Hamadaea flava TaxID=1742688 RepID=A0ABV8LK58_9ACTN|nr:helix-turn-helix domain-containing protein [Hamadaea flava]MCP2323795.1 DNA-binding transcriptional ArsR family regulator [Hamadaea flava]
MTEKRLDDAVALRAYAHPVRMRLVGLLRREGPLTATQAADKLGESVPNCSFHLRMLAKYGLVERAEGADNREKPWRATAEVTSWRSDAEDAPTREAVGHLEAMIAARYLEREQEFLRRADAEPVEWRRLTGPHDVTVYVTPEELDQLGQAVEALVSGYRDPQRPGVRAVDILQFVLTQAPPPTEE